jgi:hypothetical protein
MPSPLRLPDFSPCDNDTAETGSSPLYGWKVTRRNRAVASGGPAGRQPVFGPRHRTRARRLATDRSPGRVSGRGWDRAASGTARGVTASGHLRGGALGDAGRPPERRDASDEGSQARLRISPEPGRAGNRHEGLARGAEGLKTGRRPQSRTDADEAEPAGPPPVGRATSRTTRGGETARRAYSSTFAGRLTGASPCPPSDRARAAHRSAPSTGRSCP